MATTARQQYFADETSLSKEKREFSIADSVQQKIDSIETGAEVNVIEEVKVNGVALVPDANKAVDISVPLVIDSLSSLSTTDALSAKQGKVLYDFIQNIASRGRFLSNWNCATGLPVTNPSTSPYTYMAGDYYTVSTVAAAGGTNYRPDGSSYTIGQASTTVETSTVVVSDMYLYDGTNWVLLSNRQIAVDTSLSTTSTNPVENRVITNALNNKQDALTVGKGINIDTNDVISNTLPGPTVSATAPTNPIQGDMWYDTTDDTLKTYDGTQWNATGGGGSSGNTQTFYLSSTSDLTNAQAAYDWYAAGKNSIIVYDNNIYTLFSASSTEMRFVASRYSVSIQGGDKTLIRQPVVRFVLSSGSVTNVYQFTDNDVKVLQTGTNYSTAYTPEYPGSPATKKYVDDHDTIVSATAPSTATEGMLWYDTTNDILKVYDGTNWNTIDTNTVYTAGDHIDITNNIISTEGLQDELTAGSNITITPIIESDMKGPCPSGWHVPLKDEFVGIRTACTTLGITTGTDFQTYLKIPATGRIDKYGDITGVSGSYYLSDGDTQMGACSFLVSNITRGYSEKACALPIRPMKNTSVAPDSSWAMLYDGSSVATGAGVFHNTTDGIISISANGTTWITIADKNLGATVVYNYGDTIDATNGGNFFQWGNNYPFPQSGPTSTSSTKVDASTYGPGNYYYSDTFITGSSKWETSNNNNLWGGDTHSTWQSATVISAAGGPTYTAGNGINIDSNNEISNTQPGPSVGSTAPQSPSEGDLWYDTTNDVLKSYDGTNWNEIGSGGQNTNMQTFYLAGDQDTTTALAIGNYYISGGNPLIMYKNHVCTLQAAFNGRDDDFLRMYFQCVPFVNQADNGTVGDYETRKRGDVARIFLDFRHITYDAQHNPTAIGYVHEILIETGDSYSNFVKIDNAQTITGAKTFSISPVVPSKTSAATNTGTAVATEAQVYNVASNVNTKTFMLPYDLSSAAAVAVAQEALDWYRAGGNPILYHLGGWEQVPMPRTYYLSHADMPGSSNLLELVFVSQESHVDEQSGEWGGYDDLNFFRIHLLTNSSTTLAAATTVTAVSEDRVTGTSFYVNLRGAQTINGTKTFTTSPVVPNKTADATNTGTAIATEAQVYSVDNKTTKVSATAPSSPTEGMLRYDTTNDILKAYNGTAWKEAGTQMKVLSYGHSTWQDFIDAYNENAIVYCRASSNSNPGSGNQGRMAFMAFIDINSTTGDIQGVEFQYYRSRSSHSTAATVLDEVYIYKLTPASGGTWTVTQRDTAAEPIAGTGIGLTYNASGMTISADTSVLATKTYADDHDTAVSATAPSTATEGMLWYDTTNDVLKTYDGTNWNEVGGGGAGGGGVLRIANARIVNATSPDVTTIRLYLADNTINEGDMVYGVVDDWSYATGTLYQVKLYNSDGTTLLHTCEYLSNNFSPAAADGGVMGMYLKSGNNKYFVNLPCLEYKAGEGIDISDHRDYSAMRGPCSAGFHIPTKNEWNAVNTAGIAMGAWTADDGQWAIEYLFLPPVGYRDFTEGGEIYSGEVTGYYRTCTCNEGVSSDDSYCFKVEDGGFAEIGTEYRSNGYSIRPFKDIPVVPDSSWTRVYPYSTNYGIFHNATLGLVSLSTNGTTWYTLADKNVGATVVYDTLDAHTDANCGKLFQWGNNYGFTGPDNSGGISPTSSTQVNTSAYGPRNYYSSSTFIVSNPGDTDNEDWSTTRNSNLRGGDTGMQYIRNVISASDVVMSGDSGVTYTIRVSNSAPSGASNTTITLVP